MEQHSELKEFSREFRENLEIHLREELEADGRSEEFIVGFLRYCEPVVEQAARAIAGPLAPPEVDLSFTILPLDPEATRDEIARFGRGLSGEVMVQFQRRIRHLTSYFLRALLHAYGNPAETPRAESS